MIRRGQAQMARKVKRALTEEEVGARVMRIVMGGLLGVAVFVVSMIAWGNRISLPEHPESSRISAPAATTTTAVCPESQTQLVDENERAANIAREVLNLSDADVRVYVGSDGWISAAYSLDPWIAAGRSPRRDYYLHLWLLAPKILTAYPQACRFSLDANAIVVATGSRPITETLFSASVERSQGLLMQTQPMERCADSASYWHESPLLRNMGY